MTHRTDLAELDWKLVGMFPYENLLGRSRELGQTLDADVPGFNVGIPGSVQFNLLKQGLIPNWNEGLNSRACEWVENRFWIYITRIPGKWFEQDGNYSLIFEGLDFVGEVYFNGQLVYEFSNAFVPHRVKLDQYPGGGDKELRVVFHTPPRWLGQFGYTSRFTDLKPRYNYRWDWTNRLVQVGISGNVYLERFEEAAIRRVPLAACPPVGRLPSTTTPPTHR